MRKGNLVMIGCAAVMLLGCTAFGAEAELMPGVTVAENPEIRHRLYGDFCV